MGITMAPPPSPDIIASGMIIATRKDPKISRSDNGKISFLSQNLLLYCLQIRYSEFPQSSSV